MIFTQVMNKIEAMMMITIMIMIMMTTMMFAQVMNKIEAGKSEPRAVREVSIGTKTAPSEVY